ncbi:DHHC zinc finger domain containing protein [Tritrichomonas foetus]|uniref:Palmitoyltransferase n=1 Tax=Tritrichomonas foetus TaxID=1144522 RepID=A0A1J4K7M0_9EUKA|nr:DHHC zinc finger domain containing protein [Tritrichomonas foetus]|eukprot:OHT05708.1 DHHC zinc finger domain containing protein [Tritrichomonas foetus]
MRGDAQKQCIKYCGKCMHIFGPFSIMLGSLVLPLFHIILEAFFYASASPEDKNSALLYMLIVEGIFSTICLAFLYRSLLMASCNDPGATELQLERLTLQFSQEFIDSFPKCPKCNLPKPPRAHHCSICNKCHLRMDHHCPAVGNCVAFRNHQPFLVMLNWGIISCFLFTIYTIIFGIVEKGIFRYFTFAFSASSLLVGCFLCYFFCDQMKNVSRNVTTLEEFIEDDQDKYDLGRTENIRQMFGDGKLRFFLPRLSDMTGFEWALPKYQSQV